MEFKVALQTIFHCSLERAFKSPMLCDVSKVHTGYGIMPRVTHTTDDANWGQPGSSKKIFVAPSLTHKGGFGSIDTVLERRENEYWKIEVSQFQTWMLGFTRFTGEWATREIAPNQIQVNYTYTLHASQPLLYPFNWLFAKTFWRRYMWQVTENIRKMAEGDEAFLYE
ncbi:MAG: hypothetical protein H6581_10515 [Bacteroidia bacterium]|nr:hypothetical protein [Bacteroidia bacterium]